MDGAEKKTAWERVVVEQERADHSSGYATRHERLSADESLDGRMHERLAAVLRKSEQRHLAIADLYCSQALSSVLQVAELTARAPQHFLVAEVAALAGARAAVLTMVDTRTFETLVLASDPVARRAQALEFDAAEGPVRAVLRGRVPVEASGADLEKRWHRYGPEVAELGFDSVAAVPLTFGTVPIGVLVLFEPRRHGDEWQPEVVRLGNTLVRVLNERDSPLLKAGNQGAEVHRAAGLAALRYGRTVAHAAAMIRARASMERRSVEEVARTVIEGRAMPFT